MTGRAGGTSRRRASTIRGYARVFAASSDVTNVLVGPDFVAVGLRRPDQWEQLLDPVLQVVATEFAASATDLADLGISDGDTAGESSHPRSDSAHDGSSQLEQAWKDLGALRSERPDDLDQILAGTTSTNSAMRQVAARLLTGADADVAQDAWSRLLDDQSRVVRRATVDAMVDAGRTALRPLLEHALRDPDGWTRWKALRGIVEIGVAPSRAAVAALADDTDFRVRLEVAQALEGRSVS